MTHSENESEQGIVRGIRKGDRSAMKFLYCRYVGCLTAVCSRYVVVPDDVKDVLQDCFVKIFASIDKFEWRGDGSLKAWMVRIVVNESLKFLKRSKQLDALSYEWELPDVADEEEPEVGDVPASVVQEMLCQLPVKYRTVFNLYVLEQKSHKEIAALLNIKEGTSASQLYRAKVMLAKKIREYKSAKRWKTGG